MKAGNSASVTHEIVIDNEVVFKQGETVLIEAVSPHQERPDYKYVVTSPASGKKFLLSSSNLEIMATQSSESQPAEKPRVETASLQSEEAASEQLIKGGYAKLTQNVTVGEKVVFNQGDSVLIEDISPHPSFPEKKYVVTSRVTKQKCWLDENSLSTDPTVVLATAGLAATAPARRPVPQELAQREPVSARPGSAAGARVTEGTSESGCGCGSVAGVLVVLLVIGAVIWGIVAIFGGKSSHQAFSFKVGSTIINSSIVGTYKLTSSILDIRSDGTYVITTAGTIVSPGVWSQAVGGDGVWNPNEEPVNSKFRTENAPDYKLVGSVTLQSTDPANVAMGDNAPEDWYIIENGNILDYRYREIYVKQ